MKVEKIKCPLCGTKLYIKSAKQVNFDLPLSQAECEVWCTKCRRWIKFNLAERKMTNEPNNL